MPIRGAVGCGSASFSSLCHEGLLTQSIPCRATPGATAGLRGRIGQVRTLVFIPAWNEQASIAAVIADVREHLPDADILVVDDGSTDATTARARECGVLVATLPFNQGLGAALQTGYLYALREGYDFCAHLDSDGQHPAADVARLLAEVEADRADLVLGSRYRDPGAAEAESDDYKPTFSRRIGSGLFRFFLTLGHPTCASRHDQRMRAANRRVMALFSENYSPDFAEIESCSSRSDRAAGRGGAGGCWRAVHLLPDPVAPASSSSRA